jgi:asparagine synthase (glutamine-hydrolysing)
LAHTFKWENDTNAMILQLIHHKGFQWHTIDNISVKGYLFDKQGDLWTGENLLRYVQRFKTVHALQAALIDANGAFAVVFVSENEVLVLVDRIRSFPLFYAIANNQLLVSDDALVLSKTIGNRALDELSVGFVKYLNYAPANRTLLRGVAQLQAGQMLVYHTKKFELQLEFYYQHVHLYRHQSVESKLFDDFKDNLSLVFTRLVQSANGKTLMIPLSGGLDSRLIVAMLKQLNYKEVICYTYGNPESYEVLTAQKVAETVGYPWVFIDYTAPLYAEYTSQKAQDFRRYCGNAATFPQEQEYFALHFLTTQGLIPKDAIFVPGYCGDLPAGSYLPSLNEQKAISKGKKEALEFVLQRHTKQYRYDKEFSAVKEAILKEWEGITWNSLDEFISVHENWFTINKVSKNIVNTIRTYEYFGFEWRLPLWDNDFVSFFYDLPNHLRSDKYFYAAFLKTKLFAPLGLAFYPKTYDQKFAHKFILNPLKKFVPSRIKATIVPLLIKQKDLDVNNTSLLFQQVNRAVFKGEFKGNDINFILSSWYIQELKSDLALD